MIEYLGAGFVVIHQCLLHIYKDLKGTF